MVRFPPVHPTASIVFEARAAALCLVELTERFDSRGWDRRKMGKEGRHGAPGGERNDHSLGIGDRVVDGGNTVETTNDLELCS